MIPANSPRFAGLRLVLASLVLLVASTASPAHAQLAGRVVGIIDGDTLDVLAEGRAVRVRLAAIDAPERSQAFGNRARQALSALAFGQVATVQGLDQDRYGRALGVVFVGTTNVNAEMVRQGFAWVYRQYSRDASLLQLEEEARAAGRGLWSDPQAVPPWDYRRQR